MDALPSIIILILSLSINIYGLYQIVTSYVALKLYKKILVKNVLKNDKPLKECRRKILIWSIILSSISIHIIVFASWEPAEFYLTGLIVSVVLIAIANEKMHFESDALSSLFKHLKPQSLKDFINRPDDYFNNLLK